MRVQIIRNIAYRAGQAETLGGKQAGSVTQALNRYAPLISGAWRDWCKAEDHSGKIRAAARQAGRDWAPGRERPQWWLSDDDLTHASSAVHQTKGGPD